jgi:hypothetical protein
MSRYTAADERANALMLSQHGVASRQQLLDTGLSTKALRVRVEQHRFVVMHAGRVFRLANAPSTIAQTANAAVLAAGKTAFASHSTGAAMFLLPAPTQLRPEVTTVLERFVRIDGVRAHRSGLLVERDITTVEGVPVATPERTVLDLSGRLTETQLGHLVDEALRQRITTLSRIAICAQRLPRAPGRSPKKVAVIVDRRVRSGGTKESTLEDFVYDAIGRFGLPLPRCQYWVTVGARRYRLDMAYERARIVIEVDGFDPHRGRAMFDSDRLRGNDVTLAGYTLLRVTSAFTDWNIATTVARALRLPLPDPPDRERTVDDWLRVCSGSAL